MNPRSQKIVFTLVFVLFAVLLGAWWWHDARSRLATLGEGPLQGLPLERSRSAFEGVRNQTGQSLGWLRGEARRYLEAFRSATSMPESATTASPASTVTN